MSDVDPRFGVTTTEMRRYEVAITDYQLRCFRYRCVTRFGAYKAVHLASASHNARYAFSRDFEAQFIEVESGPAVSDIEAGEMGDLHEWDFPEI